MTSEAVNFNKQVFEKMRDLNIGINLHYIPVHMQPYYQKCIPSDQVGLIKGIA